MARYDHDGLLELAGSMLGATPDPSGQADMVFEKGSLVVIAEPDGMKDGFKRVKKIDGYRWVLINTEDLFAANTKSIGSKAGIIGTDGKILKNADIPRRKV
ncbi:MAG: hypothetical protein AAGD35_14060 [Actinomycetota bacterium]